MWQLHCHDILTKIAIKLIWERLLLSSVSKAILYLSYHMNSVRHYLYNQYNSIFIVCSFRYWINTLHFDTQSGHILLGKQTRVLDQNPINNRISFYFRLANECWKCKLCDHCVIGCTWTIYSLQFRIYIGCTHAYWVFTLQIEPEYMSINLQRVTFEMPMTRIPIRDNAITLHRTILLCLYLPFNFLFKSQTTAQQRSRFEPHPLECHSIFGFLYIAAIFN